jgi:GTP-binding protein
MHIKSAEFVKSAPGLKYCPEPMLPEYAFIGRSNVGKSSLINMIVERKSLAKTSGKPGKTRLINFFLINNEWNLVDLPGYGYAAVSKKERKSWEAMIKGYLQKRKTLMAVFMLVDSRIPPQQSDIEYINWMGGMQIPFNVVFTKTDKLNATGLEKATREFSNALLQTWSELPPVMMSSVKTNLGREEILNYIESTNRLFNPSLLKLK